MPIYLCERLTFDQLFRVSDPKRVYRSFTVRGPPLEIDSYQDTVYYCFNFKSHPSTTGLRHRGYIKFFKPKRKNPKDVPLQHLECVCDCECPDTKYRWAWANKQRGSGMVGPKSLNQAWNKAPRKTNPRGLPGLCIAEGERVSTKRGLIPIEEVIPGDSVWTLLGWKNVSAAAQTGNKQVVEVTTRSGRKIKLTADHQVYAFTEQNGFEWVPAGNLTSNHRLCVSLPSDIGGDYRSLKICAHRSHGGRGSGRNYLERDIRLDEILAELMGYMVAEGSTTIFANQNTSILEDFAKKWKQVFGPETVCCRKDVCDIGQHGYEFLKSAGYVAGSYEKIVPEWVMRGSKSIIIAFLRGCYAGDGNFRGRHSTYATVSEKLARAMQLLVSSLGVSASLDCYLSGVNNSSTWVISTSSDEETEALFRLLNPIHGRSSPVTPVKGDQAKAYHNYVIKSSRNLFKSVVSKHLSGSDDQTVVCVNSVKSIVPLCEKVSIDFVARLLNQRGWLKKERFKLSGKPHNVSTVSRLYAVLRDYRIFKTVSNVKLRRDKGYGIHRLRLTEPINRLALFLPEAYTELKTLIREDVSFDQVAKVSQADVVKVYDLTVDEASHFTCNGIVVHNCKHLLAARQYIYGLLSSFPGDEPDTAEKLNKLTKHATKRWTDFAGAQAAAKEREKQLLHIRQLRNIGAIEPKALMPAAEPEEEPEELPEVPEPPPISKGLQPEMEPGAATTGPATPVPPYRPTKAVKPQAYTNKEEAPKRVIGNRFVKGMLPGQFPGTVESIQRVVNTTGEQHMSMMTDATKLVQEMIDDERDFRADAADTGGDFPNAGGLDDIGALDEPTEPPVSDSAIGADTEGETALGLLAQMKDLLTQIATAVAPEATPGAGEAEMPEEPPADIPTEGEPVEPEAEPADHEEPDEDDEEEGDRRPVGKRKKDEE